MLYECFSFLFLLLNRGGKKDYIRQGIAWTLLLFSLVKE